MQLDPTDYPSWYDFEAAQRAEAARARARDDARQLANGLAEVRGSKRSRSQAAALVEGLEALVGSMRQVSARRWEGGRRGPDIGTDPAKWPKTIDTRGLSSL